MLRKALPEQTSSGLSVCDGKYSPAAVAVAPEQEGPLNRNTKMKFHMSTEPRPVGHGLEFQTARRCVR
jgi:hypothetical protein